MKKEQTVVPARERLVKKLVLNKETIRILTDREMMEVEGASCPKFETTCPVTLTCPSTLDC
jgi:hypothetical protein